MSINIIYLRYKKLIERIKKMNLYEWSLENEALVMFVIIPALLLPVGFIVEKLIQKFDNC